MNGNESVIAFLVILVAFSVFYFNRARRTCHRCENSGLRKTGKSKLYEDGAQEEYKCTYCGAQEWKGTLFPLPEGAKWKNQIESWRRFSNQIGGEFFEEGPDARFLLLVKLLGLGTRKAKVRLYVKKWTITLYASREESVRTGLTRVKAVEWTSMGTPYVSKDGFEFMIFPEGVWIEGGVCFDPQDVEVGYPELDRDFIIKANDESKVRALFANTKIPQLIQAHPSFERFGAGSYEGKYEVYFRRSGITTNIEGLEALLELCTETLNQLVAIGSASEEAPNVEL